MASGTMEHAEYNLDAAAQSDLLMNLELFPELDLFSLEYQEAYNSIPFDFDVDLANENLGAEESTTPQDDLLLQTTLSGLDSNFPVDIEPTDSPSSSESASSTPSTTDELATSPAAQPPQPRPKRAYIKRRLCKTIVEGPVVPHGVIERRYRKKLDTHIDQLRAAVPTIRPGEYDSRGRREGLAKGLKCTHKKNKATVYAKALEYIQHLEKMCLEGS